MEGGTAGKDKKLYFFYKYGSFFGIIVSGITAIPPTTVVQHHE
jgi:hypothetical protein